MMARATALAPAMAVALAAGLALCACATYQPVPLDLDSQSAADVAALQHATALPPRLGVEDVALLAVQNNPDLIAARTRHGLAQAQSLEAGLLPNPSLSASYEFLVSGAGTANPVTAALSEDVRALITLSSRRRAARRSAQEIDASVLWEEWQTSAKARLAAVDFIEGERQRQGLQQLVTLLQARAARARAALERGDTTLTALVPELSAAADARKQLDDLERQQDTRRRELNGLLGLRAEAPLRLAERVALPPLEDDAVAAGLPDLPRRRPDLLALQLGYEAQEERVRAAILAQFPLFSLGLAGERDNTDIRSVGPQITLDLPVFDRNQGNIAVERATRAQLHAEFTARLLAARGEALTLLSGRALLRQQLAGARAQLAELSAAASRGESAFQAGDLDERSYIDLLTTRAAKNQEVLAMEQTLLEQQVALALVVGAGMPPASLAAPGHS
ncbi:MAG TPA: TolC family protein [Steroidobacteraceae bacterium]